MCARRSTLNLPYSRPWLLLRCLPLQRLSRVSGPAAFRFSRFLCFDSTSAAQLSCALAYRRWPAWLHAQLAFELVHRPLRVVRMAHSPALCSANHGRSDRTFLRGHQGLPEPARCGWASGCIKQSRRIGRIARLHARTLPAFSARLEVLRGTARCEHSIRGQRAAVPERLQPVVAPHATRRCARREACSLHTVSPLKVVG